MKPWLESLMWLLIGLAGCAPIGGSHRQSAPDPAPADPVEAAAAAYLVDYAGNLATAADTVAAGEFRSWDDAFRSWQGATKQAREQASAKLDAAVQSTGEFGDFDSERFKRLMRSHAAGFRRAAR